MNAREGCGVSRARLVRTHLSTHGPRACSTSTSTRSGMVWDLDVGWMGSGADLGRGGCGGQTGGGHRVLQLRVGGHDGADPALHAGTCIPLTHSRRRSKPVAKAKHAPLHALMRQDAVRVAASVLERGGKIAVHCHAVSISAFTTRAIVFHNTSTLSDASDSPLWSHSSPTHSTRASGARACSSRP